MTSRKKDEAEFTPWAQPGWHAWDAISPEVEFCEFAGLLQKFLAPAVTLETGVGAGRITDYLDRAATEWLGYEAEEEFRLVDGSSDEPTPSLADISRADFVILDSNPPWRLTELSNWKGFGKPGSVCLVHDAGNGHPAGSFHYEVGEACRAAGSGLFLKNPRGAWLGIHL